MLRKWRAHIQALFCAWATVINEAPEALQVRTAREQINQHSRYRSCVVTVFFKWANVEKLYGCKRDVGWFLIA